MLVVDNNVHIFVIFEYVLVIVRRRTFAWAESRRSKRCCYEINPPCCTRQPCPLRHTAAGGLAAFHCPDQMCRRSLGTNDPEKTPFGFKGFTTQFYFLRFGTFSFTARGTCDPGAKEIKIGAPVPVTAQPPSLYVADVGKDSAPRRGGVCSCRRVAAAISGGVTGLSSFTLSAEHSWLLYKVNKD